MSSGGGPDFQDPPGSSQSGSANKSGMGERKRVSEEKKFWKTESQTLKNISTSTTTMSRGKFISPYGDYDMDDCSFFAHTTRLNIVGPSMGILRRRRSSSTERLLTTATKKDRSRSLSPPPPALPTDYYIKLSLQSSLPLSDPTASRKLLVLDLNGTLLLRSAHSGRRAPPPPPPHSGSKRPDTTTSHPLPALRTVYPRPYLPSFRTYLFHPTTLQWLDTMVWSSAQPHSVNDMVEKCFGTYQKELKAVWARDTLGLSSDEYYKKTQTTKDLTKPWAQIPSLLSNLQPHSPQPFTDNQDSLPQRQHSALTTILMDDSPLKAVLQPWNHLCVSEYELSRRRLDVGIARRELGGGKETSKLDKSEVGGGTHTVDGDGTTTHVDTLMESEKETDKNQETERKRKRKEKKMLKKEKLVLAKEQQQQLEATPNQTMKKEEITGGAMGVEMEERYDEMLLAVIGILDRLKREGNVAGWMRSGGLIRGIGDQETTLNGTPSPSNVGAETTGTLTQTTMTIPPPSTISPSPLTTPSTKRDSSSMSTRSPSSKRRRLTATTNSSDSEMDTTTGERGLESADSDSEMVAPPTTSMTRKTRTTEISISSPLPSSSPSQAEQASTGVSTSTLTVLAPEESSPSRPLLWYETSSVLSHWAQQGRKALGELGIEIVSGVVPLN